MRRSKSENFASKLSERSKESCDVTVALCCLICIKYLCIIRKMESTGEQNHQWWSRSVWYQ